MAVEWLQVRVYVHLLVLGVDESVQAGTIVHVGVFKLDGYCVVLLLGRWVQ